MKHKGLGAKTFGELIGVSERAERSCAVSASPRAFSWSRHPACEQFENARTSRSRNSRTLSAADHRP